MFALNSEGPSLESSPKISRLIMTEMSQFFLFLEANKPTEKAH